MSDIFISYSSDDIAIAKEIAEELQSRGWSVFWDRTVPPGKDGFDIIEFELENARCVIVLWSKSSIKSKWVKEEAGEGLEKEILIPVFIEKVRPPFGFKRIQAADLTNWKRGIPNSEFDKLIKSIQSLSGMPSKQSKPDEKEPSKRDTTTSIIEQPLKSSESDEDTPSEIEFKIPSTTGKSVSLLLRRIPAGSFLMGSPEEEKDRRQTESPQHQVTIPHDIYLGKYPITQKQWRAVLGKNPANFKGNTNRPVECVSWDDCKDFIQKLNDLGQGTFRLPSEAEWEYACRAGTDTRFYWGNDSEYKEIDQFAWFSGNSSGKTHPIGKKEPNPWGLYDMNGNVWEWCEDDWHENYKGAPQDGSAWIDSPRGSARVIRGGSWLKYPGNCRSAIRNAWTPDDRSGHVGFRVVYSRT